MNKPNAIPEGYSSVTPYLVVEGAVKAIEFYKNAFGAKEIMRFPGPDGKIGHAELQIGDSKIMLADENPMSGKDPRKLGGSPVSLMLYVEKVDQVVEKAASLGAQIKHPVENKFYGDRSGSIIDPFGHIWHISTHIEDVSPEEMQKRMDAMMASKA